MKDIKTKNNVLYTCVSCIMVLLLICYFGINSSVKGTYSAYSCIDGYTAVKSTDSKYYCIPDDFLNSSAPSKMINGKEVIVHHGDDGLWKCSFETVNPINCVDTFGSGWQQDTTPIGALCTASLGVCGYAISGESVKYTIKYDLNGGSGTFADQTKTAGTAITIPTTKPTRSGYEFVKWIDIGDNGKSYNPGASFTRDANATLTAEWVVVKPDITDVTITLSAKTATYTGSAIAANNAAVTPNSGGTVTTTYYTDSSCNTKTTTVTGASAEGKAPVDAGTYYVQAIVAANGNYNSATSACVKHIINKKSLSVSWTGGTSFIYNGSNQGPKASVSTGISGETLNLSYDSAKDVGSHISTATCKSVTGGRAKCTNYSLTNSTKSYTIAKEEEDEPVVITKTFTATFNPNGGIINGKTSASCTTDSSSCDITGLPTATKDGYTFKGWGTSSTCSSGNISKITLSSNKTYYACWVKNVSEKTDEDGNVTENSKTGEFAILFVWIVGTFAIIYLCRYFKREKEN